MMFFRLLFKNLKYTFSLNKLYKKQTPEYETLQLSHRLEKGLTIKNKKKNWGVEKAERLIQLLEKLSREKKPNTEFALNVGGAVLSKYLDDKKIDCALTDELCSVSCRLNKIMGGAINDKFGGTTTINRRPFNESIFFKDVLNSRHSVRVFSEEKPELEHIFDAVQLANKCPSACNRQAFKVHIIDNQKRNMIEKQIINAPYFLIVTGLCSAYTRNEIGDAVVSASIYTGYLSLTLNYYGIDNCVIKKDIFNDASFNKKARKILKLEDDEQIVLEIALGFPQNDTKVPVSMRKSLDLLCVNHIDEENKK